MTHLPTMPAPFVELPLQRRTDVGSFARPSVHREMLLDRARLSAFREAIARSVVPGMAVLEIGAGTGILSVLAAQAGAGHVISIEASALAATAKRVVADNGLAHKIEIVESTSFEVDLPRPADLLITETLGHIGIDEGLLESAADARRRLLVPDAPIIPRRVVVTASPVSSPAFRRRFIGFWLDGLPGCKLQAMAALSYRSAYVTTPVAYELLAAPRPLIDIVVGADPPDVIAGEACVSGLAKGRLDGLALGFEAELAPGQWLRSRQTSSWRPVLLPITPAVEVAWGATVKLAVRFPSARAACDPSWAVAVV